MANSNNGSANTAGASGVGVVQIVFLILKLCKIAPIKKWPWWKVMLPTECSIGLLCCVGCCAAGCGIISLCFTNEDNIPKPGVVLTEEKLRMFENTFEKTPLQTQKQGTVSVDSGATTSPSKHFSKETSKDGTITTIPENQCIYHV